MLIKAKYHLNASRASVRSECSASGTTYIGLIFISGIGQHVKSTVTNRNDFRPHTSEYAPRSGELKNVSKPLNECTAFESVR